MDHGYGRRVPLGGKKAGWAKWLGGEKLLCLVDRLRRDATSTLQFLRHSFYFYFILLPAFYFIGKRTGLIHVRHQTMPASCPPPHAATINKTREAALPEGGSGVGAHVRHPHTAAATKTPGQAAEYLSACVRYRPRLPLALFASSPLLDLSLAPSRQHLLVHKNRVLTHTARLHTNITAAEKKAQEPAASFLSRSYYVLIFLLLVLLFLSCRLSRAHTPLARPPSPSQPQPETDNAAFGMHAIKPLECWAMRQDWRPMCELTEPRGKGFLLRPLHVTFYCVFSSPSCFLRLRRLFSPSTV
ncbi:hypothetical protein GGI43DRAFT_11006 [Trichoderma evansii]